VPLRSPPFVESFEALQLDLPVEDDKLRPAASAADVRWNERSGRD
jgi:hypothetical protein